MRAAEHSPVVMTQRGVELGGDHARDRRKALVRVDDLRTENWNPLGDQTTLAAPLRWKAPRRVLLWQDLFQRSVPDDLIVQVYAVMALGAPRMHTFYLRTSRPDRMVSWLDLAHDNCEHAVGAAMRGLAPDDPGLPEWPLPNVWVRVDVD